MQYLTVKATLLLLAVIFMFGYEEDVSMAWVIRVKPTFAPPV